MVEFGLLQYAIYIFLSVFSVPARGVMYHKVEARPTALHGQNCHFHAMVRSYFSSQCAAFC